MVGGRIEVLRGMEGQSEGVGLITGGGIDIEVLEKQGDFLGIGGVRNREGKTTILVGTGVVLEEVRGSGDFDIGKGFAIVVGYLSGDFVVGVD